MKALKRNAKRFPESFCFQLTEDEYADLRSA
ncbi:MAG: ORF6N domain-containing protein [Lachnospiraceae bacterium]